MSESDAMPRGLARLGPGILIAATGVGAGDLIAAAVAGRQFGLALLWVVVMGALCKWLLNEGIARWSLATGESVIKAWATRLPRSIFWYFGTYLVVWGFLVGGALGSACGVAFKAFWPDAPGSVAVWAVVHALAGGVVVGVGRYQLFERVMQTLIALMFLFVIGCGIALVQNWPAVFAGLVVPKIPEGALWVSLGLMGGVGGSATLLCYGYWLKEKGWEGPRYHRVARWDLLLAYGLTAAFGIAMVIIAAEAEPRDASGTALVVALSEELSSKLGTFGGTVFLGGFWCAVFTSLLGVWQGVPYLFEDWWKNRRSDIAAAGSTSGTSRSYYSFLIYLMMFPLVLQVMDRPLLVVMLYAVAGAFFMPLLASTLLVLNNRRDWVGDLKNPLGTNLGLVASLVLFGLLFALELKNRFGGG
ncbi:MAG: Nramp family divalent metal transporter [Synoicihabitans sp.]